MIRSIAYLLVGFVLGFAVSHFTTTSSVTKSIDAKSSKAEVKRVGKQLKANDQAGNSFEKKRREIDGIYQEFAKEASNDAPHEVDDCVLPAERLRRWRAANAGPLRGSATGESDPATPSTTTAEGWQGNDAGREPPGGDEAVPPASGSTVRAASTVGH